MHRLLSPVQSAMFILLVGVPQLRSGLHPV